MYKFFYLLISVISVYKSRLRVQVGLWLVGLHCQFLLNRVKLLIENEVMQIQCKVKTLTCGVT